MPTLDRPPTGPPNGPHATRRVTVRARLSEFSARSKPVFSWFPAAGLVPSFLLATWSLTQPWAEGRAFLLIGISRSPEALVLVLVTLLGMVGAGVAVAARGKRHGLAAVVHVTTGVTMGFVAFAAFRMIQDAPTRLLGVIPLASVGPGAGLRLFLLAAGCVFVLGAFEFGAWIRQRAAREDAVGCD